MDINRQQPYTVDQISNDKPNAPKTETILTGYIANSMNGGHNKTIAYKKIMAGERHKEYRVKLQIQMLTPKTPPYQKLKATIRTYFVPNSRIWTNAEKYTAQKGGTSEIKIEEIPNMGGKKIPVIYFQGPGGEMGVAMNHTELWRDSFISSYIPRTNYYAAVLAEEFTTNAYNVTMPKASILPLRGRVAIYNDMERNKEYDEEIVEYKDDTVSQAEWESYLPLDKARGEFYFMRAKRENNYYTDYRTDIQGLEETIPTENPISSLVDWATWESKIAEARSQAENAQANDWDIIAKIRGSKVLTEGKVQLIGKKTFDINYSAITQNAYNTNQDITEEFQVMGKQGAYSYTEINVPIYAGMEFNEEGYIHVIMNVTADTVFETAFDRNELNITPLDEYRPDLVGDKFDVLKSIEIGTNQYYINSETQVIGFKRKYSEYFKLPNIVAGDMTTKNYFQNTFDNFGGVDEQIITQKTYQFFEESGTEGGEYPVQYGKHIWKDYTDMLINKNQAILNSVQNDGVQNGSMYAIRLRGQNQIFFVGMCQCLADLPIDQSIKVNYTQWGEH